MAAPERGHEHESRHPVMTEAMISRLPARRDGTGYAFILRDGLAPVIARPPVIWHGPWYKQFTRRAQRRSQAARRPAPGPRRTRRPGLGRHRAAARRRARAGAAGQPRPGTPGTTTTASPARNPDQPRPARAARAWDETGGGS